MPTDTADTLIDRGLAHQQAARYAQAAADYEAALALEPDHPDALHLLGLVAQQQGDHDAAGRWIDRAIAADPDAAEFHANRGEVFRSLRQFDQAIASYQRSLDLEPGRVEVLRNLGLAAQLARKFDVALHAWDEALRIEPNHPPTLNNRGVTLRHLHRADEALQAFEAAVQDNADFREPLDNIVDLLNRLGRHDEAVAAAELVTRARPNDPIAYVAYGCALNDAGRPKEAITPIYEALKLDPECVSAHLGMGLVFCATREFRGAELAFRKALDIQPKNLAAQVQLSFVLLQRGEPGHAIGAAKAGLEQFPESYELLINLASAQYQVGLMWDAAESAEKALDLKPQLVLPYNLLGSILSRLGNFERAEEIYNRGIALAPGNLEIIGNYSTMLALKGDLRRAIDTFRQSLGQSGRNADYDSNMLLYLNGLPGVEPAEVFEEHRAWGERHVRHLVPAEPKFEVDRDPDRPLRVGYVSGDFRFHSVAYFAEPILAGHDRSKVIPVIYDNVLQPDAMTAHFRQHVSEWHRVVQMKNEELAAKIRADKIDVLVDLSGHTGGHRLPTFAERPAPVQASYLGYPNTTGVPGIHYRLTDAVADPPGLTDAFHTEKLVRLPGPFVCYRPSEGAPEVGPLPAETNGHITFCSFNAISKFNASAVAVWAKVLLALPDARMLIKAVGLQETATQQRILEYFERCGVPRSRLELLPRAPTYNSHMGTYNLADIALDTFPYNGTTTTCEALWMGVPVLTLAGRSHVARVSASILTSIGLESFVATDEEEFVNIAVDYAANLKRLADVRRGMRERLATSPLMDARAKAAAMESAYRQMWHDWLAETAAR